MAIDFRLTASQRELQLRSRKFAKEVLSPAIEAETLPTPEERFAATKPAYEAMIAAGFLRKCIPLSAGGESTGLTATAIMVEELYAVYATAGRGSSHHSEVVGRQMDHPGPQELDFLGHGLGSQGCRPSVGTLPHRS